MRDSSRANTVIHHVRNCECRRYTVCIISPSLQLVETTGALPHLDHCDEVARLAAANTAPHFYLVAGVWKLPPRLSSGFNPGRLRYDDLSSHHERLPILRGGSVHQGWSRGQRGRAR